MLLNILTCTVRRISESWFFPPPWRHAQAYRLCPFQPESGVFPGHAQFTCQREEESQQPEQQQGPQQLRNPPQPGADSACAAAAAPGREGDPVSSSPSTPLLSLTDSRTNSTRRPMLFTAGGSGDSPFLSIGGGFLGSHFTAPGGVKPRGSPPGRREMAVV